MRVNITMNDELLSEIDNYAKQHHMSRSAFLASASLRMLRRDQDQAEANSILADFMSCVSDAFRSGSLDQSRLDDLADRVNSLKSSI